MEITLDQLLASREQRAARQQELLTKYPHSTLVCLTVIMPGSVKRNFFSIITANAAIQAMLNKYEGSIEHFSLRDLVTGYEGYLVTNIDREQAKRIACDIEDTHALGRLFDIDVLDEHGIPMSRSTVNHKPRRCLVCSNEARYCMRAHTHTHNELQSRIKDMIEAYVHRV